VIKNSPATNRGRKTKRGEKTWEPAAGCLDKEKGEGKGESASRVVQVKPGDSTKLISGPEGTCEQRKSIMER